MNDSPISTHNRLIEQAQDIAGQIAAVLEPGSAPTDFLPGYKIIREIHSGGQGLVYEALQRSTRRTVAVKVLHQSALAGPHARDRFEREVRILGKLHHPNIIAIHDSGTAEGRFYFVMDYIDGPSLDVWLAECDPSAADAEAQADRRKRSRTAKSRVEAVLNLFIKICDAVNAAHLHGIIHRDLKPGNIRVDASGEPRVFDFGLAKTSLQTDDSSGVQDLTLEGQFVGTLAWASPEQAAGDPDRVDIRTDVYSLGMMLYYALMDQLPYPITGGPRDILNHILSTNPARPSTVCRWIDHDLETILLKCLAKEPDRRYATAGELAADLRRWLNHEPVLARPAGGWYQFRKFARRNKAWVSGAAAVFVALVAGLIGTASGYVRAEEQRQLAEERSGQLQQATDFQAEMLGGIDPEEMGYTIVTEFRKQVEAGLRAQWIEDDDGKMRKMTDEEIASALQKFDEARGPANSTDVAREMMNITVLQPALETIARRFADQPEVDAELRHTIGRVYQALGLPDQAESQIRMAVDLLRGAQGRKQPELAASLYDLAVLLQNRGDYPGAESLYREALAIRRELLGDEHPDVATSLYGLASLLAAKGGYAEAELLFIDALAMQRRLLGDQHLKVARTLSALGSLLRGRGRYPEAEPLLREALAIQRKSLGDEHPSLAKSLIGLARTLQVKGDYPAAEQLFREAMALSRKALGNEHPDTARCMSDLGALLRIRGRYDEAQALLHEALAMNRRFFGDQHPEVAASLDSLAALERDLGHYEAAEQLFREALAIRRSLLGDEDREVATSLNNLAMLLVDRGEYDAAEPLCRDALTVLRKLLGNENQDVALTLQNLALVLHNKRQYDAAEPLYREALAIQRHLPGSHHVNVACALYNLASLLHDKGDYPGAEPLYREALTILRGLFGDRHLQVELILSKLASLLQDKGDPAAAEPMAREALSINIENLEEGNWLIAASRSRLGDILTHLDRYSEAEPLLLEAWESLRDNPNVPSEFRIKTLQRLVSLYDAWGQPDRADEYRIMLPEESSTKEVE